MGLRAGVLIVGSLAWDRCASRREWRATRLSMHRRRRVTAPIRYGRRSDSRDGTYTMVFSADCVVDGIATGVGLAVPFKNAVESVADLLGEAAELWRVEDKAGGRAGGQGKGGVRRRPAAPLSAAWGSVALLPNPASTEVLALLPAWADAVSRSPGYGALPVAKGEAAIVREDSGLAVFPWPRAAESEEPLRLDLLLMTATAAEITGGRYPSAEKVCAAWNEKPERAEYFWNNRALGIRTADDAAIGALLDAG